LHILRITQEDAMKDNSAIIQVQLPVEVATFLLNEKRADIHAIEQRMGVEVVLIPNIHLETPNYNIVRVKHDDVTEETSRASYKLVELPTETSYIPTAEETAKEVRPVAAVRGITPAAPAPIVAEKSASAPILSLLDRIKNLFSSASSSSKQKTEAEKNEEFNRDRNRNNRNRNRNRNDRNKNAPQDRQNRPNDGKPQEAKTQEQRPAKPQQQRQPQHQQANGNAEINPSETMPNSERTGGRRNRNNRRGRRDRGEGAQADNESVEALATTEMPVANTAENVVVNTPTALPAATVSEPTKPAKKARPEKAAKIDAELVLVDTAPVTTATSEPVVSDKAVAASTKADNKRPARARKAAAKPVDLAAAGLQLVETKADAPKANPVVNEPKARAPRKPAAWQKDAKTQSINEPMVMVETQNK
jgi:ribonuclease E